MIYEHEIPTGSKLYFGASARLKREIESVASKLLIENRFEEIVTPFFSYHQHGAIDEKELIRFGDESNHLLSLRADSTMDVVRLIGKRLGRSIKQNRWFYIQPVFKFPNIEINQIGAEQIGCEDFSLSIQMSIKVFKYFELEPLLHICNINIPKLLAEEFDLDLSIFENGELQKLLSLDIAWLRKLAKLQHPEDLEEILDEAPLHVREELLRMKSMYDKIDYKKVVFSPLYYAKMRYYDGLFFRFINKNLTLGLGGSYENDGIKSSGFGLYTDAIIDTILKK